MDYLLTHENFFLAFPNIKIKIIVISVADGSRHVPPWELSYIYPRVNI